MNRRTFIAIGAGTVALAGCTASSDDQINPTVDDDQIRETDDGLEFVALVRNDGATGDAILEVKFFDSSDNELDSETEIVSLSADETTTVTVDVDPPEDTEYYEYEVRPT